MENLAIYLRLTDYKPSALTTNGIYESNVAPIKDTFDTNSTQFIKISSYSSDVEQTLNIGSQSTGAAAGKIVFHALKITKSIDAISPILFQSAASGTPFKSAEVFFVGPQNVISVRHIYKLAAVKTIAWDASSGDAGLDETITFEYGGLYVMVNQQGPDGKITGVQQSGWNRIKNIKDGDLNSVLL